MGGRRKHFWLIFQNLATALVSHDSTLKPNNVAMLITKKIHKSISLSHAQILKDDISHQIVARKMKKNALTRPSWGFAGPLG